MIRADKTGRAGSCLKAGSEGAGRKRARRSDEAAAPFLQACRDLLPRPSGRACTENDVMGVLNMYGSEGADYVNFTCDTDTKLSCRRITHEEVRALKKSISLYGMCAWSCASGCIASTRLKYAGDTRAAVLTRHCRVRTILAEISRRNSPHVVTAVNVLSLKR